MVLFETKSPSNSCLAIGVAFDRAIFVPKVVKDPLLTHVSV